MIRCAHPCGVALKGDPSPLRSVPHTDYRVPVLSVRFQQKTKNQPPMRLIVSLPFSPIVHTPSRRLDLCFVPIQSAGLWPSVDPPPLCDAVGQGPSLSSPAVLMSVRSTLLWRSPTPAAALPASRGFAALVPEVAASEDTTPGWWRPAIRPVWRGPCAGKSEANGRALGSSRRCCRRVPGDLRANTTPTLDAPLHDSLHLVVGITREMRKR